LTTFRKYNKINNLLSRGTMTAIKIPYNQLSPEALQGVIEE